VNASGHDLRETINKEAMSRFQVVAVAICVTLNMLDGFDVLVMAFTASEVSAHWSLSGKELGLLLSAGLFGMAAGSLFVAPWGDRFGRRAITLFCLSLITLGMFLSALSQSAVQLFALRILTGLGIGGMLASINVITAEYSSDKWRSTAISIQATGYPIGATIGGTIAAVLIAYYGWRSVFLFGAVVSAAMIPVVILRLPESLDFLLAKQPANALEKLNALLTRMQRGAVTRLPDPPAAVRSSGPGLLRGILSTPLTGSTVCIWTSFFLVMFSFYFVLSWTPKLLVAAGLSTQQGITGGVLLNVGGIVGGTVFGLLAAKFNLKRLEFLYLVAAAGFIALFGGFAADLAFAFVIAIAIGIFLFGSMVGLYAITPILYPAGIRTTGMGWAIGMGRIGAILAPLIAGLLVDAGWETPHLYYAFAVPMAIAVLSVRALPLQR